MAKTKDLIFKGEGTFQLQLPGRVVRYGGGDTVKDVPSKVADALLARKVNGQAQWAEATAAAEDKPSKKKGN